MYKSRMNSHRCLRRKEDYTYGKIHLAGAEKDYWIPGNRYQVFDTSSGRIGVCICWDMPFLEYAKASLNTPAVLQRCNFETLLLAVEALVKCKIRVNILES